MARCVLLGHQRQAKLLDPLAGHGEADQAAPEARHEVDRVGCRALGGNDQIALVLAVLVVDQDEHAALAGLLEDFLDRGEIGLIGRIAQTGDEVGFLDRLHNQMLSARRAT